MARWQRAVEGLLVVKRPCRSTVPGELTHTHVVPGLLVQLSALAFLVAIIIVFLVSPNHGFVADPVMLWLFLFGGTLLVLFLVGWTVSGVWRGIFINDRRIVSLARFQAILWIAIILSGVLTVFFTRFDQGIASPFAFEIPAQVQALAGIGLVSGGAAAFVSANRRNKDPDPGEYARSAEQLAQTFGAVYREPFQERLNEAVSSGKNVASSLLGVSSSDVAASVVSRHVADVISTSDSTILKNVRKKDAGHREALLRAFIEVQVRDHESQGALYANSRVCDARFRDMIQGDEITNTAILDLAKLQMLFFTVVTVGLYLATLIQLFARQSILMGLPEVADGAVAILGLSHLGFLSGKAAGPTKTR